MSGQTDKGSGHLGNLGKVRCYPPVPPLHRVGPGTGAIYGNGSKRDSSLIKHNGNNGNNGNNGW